MRIREFKKTLSVMLSVILLFSISFEIMMNASALNSTPKATFSYGNYNGVQSAIGTKPEDIVVSGEQIILPDNENAINLYWSNGKKLYKAGSSVSVSNLEKDNDGNYPFVATFGSFSMDYDEIDTKPFTFYTDGGTSVSNDGFFSHLNKNSWWHIPSGYANDGKNTAFGASSFAIKKRTDSTGNNLFLKPWEGNAYKNAAFFTHSPFDANDSNAYNSNASGSVHYKYAYFTPGEEYTLSFDYMLDTTGGGKAPYTVSIAFGMDTATSNANCGTKTVEYADGSIARTNVDLGTDSKVWKRTSVTVKAPEGYTGNGITSARMGISCNIQAGGGCYIDNIDVQYAGTKVVFKYENAEGSSSVFGNSKVAYADEEGNFTVPKDDSAINLLWKHGNTLYEPGTNLNVNDFGEDLTFTAYFGGANLDFDNVCTSNISMADGSVNQNLYLSLSRNADYWKIPKGLSNTPVNSRGNYGLALGHDRMAVVPNEGKTGNALRLRTNVNGPHNLYRSAALFAHNPTSFNGSSSISYSYVYYAPDTEYTMEFDYKTVSEISATIAFGVNPAAEFDQNAQSVTVNSDKFGTDGTLITLPATGDEWKHASITITSPSSYIGNGITSGRVGIAVKDNEPNGSFIRYNHFDNVVFYPTSMTKDTLRIIYRFENTEEDSRTISYFKANKPLKVNSSISLPDGSSLNAGIRKGVNKENVAWSTSHGKISNLTGWNLMGSDKVFSLQDKVLLQDLPKDAVLSAVYGDGKVDFNNLSNDFKFYVNNDTSYGYISGKVMGDSNKYANLTGSESQNGSNAQVLLFTDKDQFLGYNTGKTYKVTFKYRRTDTKDVDSKLFFAFGAIPWGWRAESGCVSRIEIGLTQKGMTDFETVTDYVTAPDGYLFSTGGTNPEYFYSRTMAVGATLSNGVSIDFDDIEISLYEPDENSVNEATFDYGSSKEFGDTKTVKFTDDLYLPIKQNPRAGMRAGTNSEGVNWSTKHGQISNHSGWYCTNNKKYYALGERVSANEVGKNPKFVAVYEDGFVNFDNLSNDFKFYVSNETSYGYMSGKVMGDSNKYVNLTGGESQNGSRAQVLLFTDKDKFLGYNTGKTYKVTFKYRRTDTKDVDSKLFFAFGAIPWGWRAESGCVSRIEIGLTQKGMTDFETVTEFVTAPDGYLFNTGGTNPEYFYSRTMAVGATLSNGVSIDIDDIEISLFEPDGNNVNIATFDYGSSKEFSDAKTVKFTDELYLPIKQSPRACMRAGTNKQGVNWSAKHGQISNHSAWYCSSNNTYYNPGEKVSADEVGKNPKFIAIYEDGFVNFNNISNDFEFFTNNETSYGYANAKIKGDANKYVNLTGGAAQKNSRAQVLLFTDKEQFLGYNTGKTYKVTFKYRRTDNQDADSKLFFAFGAIPWGWRSESGCVSRVEIGSTKKGMTGFETVTVYVTAPDTYLYYADGKSPEYFYSRTMALGTTLSNGVSVDFDDISVQPIGRDEVSLTFSVPDRGIQKIVIGKTGNKLTIPAVELDRNSIIEGWYTDNKLKNKFTLNTFPKNNMIVYGKVGDAKVRYYGFVDYPWDTSTDETGNYARTERHVIEKGLSSDGDGYALKIVNTDSQADQEQQSIALPLGVKPNTKYLISYDFYYDTLGDRASQYSHVWFNTSVTSKAWKGVQEHVTTTDEYIPANLNEKKWYTGYVYGTTTEYDWSNRLVLMVRVPVGAIRYIDNITVTEISENERVVLWKLGSFQSPKPSVVKKNTSVTLPKPTIEGNYVFLNWMLENEDYKQTTYLVEEDTVFTAKTTTNRFDESFENTYYGKNGITSFGMDMDWEIYDSSVGNKSNVRSGRYSLHRIGKDIRNTAYCFHHNSFVTEYSMAEGQIYTATLWVKIENPVHKLGSIDIASCISLGDPWDFPSDRFNMAPISDIADGDWHELSYTFMASGPYLSIVVPGNLSIYIDDLTVTYTPDAQMSENCKFEEYVPANLTEDGKYIKPMSDDELGSFKLVKRTQETMAANGGLSTWLIVVICLAAAVVCGGGTTAVLLLIRKKGRR